MVRLTTSVWLLWSCLWLAACPGLDKAEKAATEIDADGKICGDQTLDDLIKADGISDECRAKVESLLPSPQSNFKSRLFVLGQTRASSGERTLYFMGAGAEGNALFTSSPAHVKVSLTVAGQVRALAEGEVSVALTASGDLLSLGVVNDYSASMRDSDLDVVSEIETDLFSTLPAIYEAEVTQFSTTVQLKQSFTPDPGKLLSAVALDEGYERESTALFDGMGSALDSLVSRPRPLRVLVVSTDGAENASMKYQKAQLLQTSRDKGVVVVMLGALFADVGTLKELAGDRGVYVYARGYNRLKSAMSGLIAALGQVVAVHLPKESAEATEATVELDGQHVAVPLM